jgi:hypothetical protein
MGLNQGPISQGPTGIDGASGLLADPQYSREIVIFDPSVSASFGNVYKTYAEVETALAALGSYPTDLVFVGACTIPAGGPYRAAGVRWMGNNAFAGASVAISEGATFNTLPWYVDRTVAVTSNATATPPFPISGVGVVFLGEAANISSSTAVPLIKGDGAATIVLFGASGSVIGDGSNAAVELLAGDVIVYTGFGITPTVNNNSIKGAAGSTYQWDANNAAANVPGTHPAMLGTIAQANGGGGASLIALDDTSLALGTPVSAQDGFDALFSGAMERLRFSNTSGAPGTPVEGDFWYDNAAQTLAVQTGVTGAEGVILQLGQEVVALGTNKTGAQIDNGDLVYVSGAQGNRPTVAKYIADGSMDDDITLGFATHDIADNATGFVTTFGLVRDLDTSAYSEGDKLYASPTTAGEWTDTAPVAPDDRVLVGYVTTSHATQGVIFARIQFMDGEQHHLTTASSNPTTGTFDLLGHHTQVATGQAVDNGAPYVSASEFCNSQAVINATVVSGAFALEISGSSVDEATGVITPADTEEIAVSTTGWYASTKKWIGTPTFTNTTGAATSTCDIYKTRYWDDKNQDFRVTGLRVEWTPSAASWSFTYSISRVETDGQLTQLESKAFASTDSPVWAAANEVGTWKLDLLTHDVEGSGAEGIVITVSNTNIRYLYSDVEYTHT